mgnify:CR=1 FL=1
MGTPHNKAKKGEIAEIVLMPGDPLRAKWIAEEFLDEPVCFNDIRSMLGYTGFYKGKRISVMGSGMGMPSMGIYSYELFHTYDAEAIIRVGSAGVIREDLHLGDVILAMGACTNSNYAAQYRLPGFFAPIADYTLLSNAAAAARRLNIPAAIGNVLSSDTFYTDDKENDLVWQKMHVLAVEMEAASLYMNAARAGKKALCILTASDNIISGEGLSAQQRVAGFRNMILTALESLFS